MNAALQQYPTPFQNKLLEINIWNSAVLLDDNDDFLCGLCSNICNKPMTIGCEKAHVYCQTCLNQYLKQNKERACVLCKDKSFTIVDKNIIHNKFAEKQINKLKVQCLYSQTIANNDAKNDDFDEGMSIEDTQHKNYCEWTGIFADLLTHINNDCKFKPINMIRCDYYKFGCNETLKPTDLSKHLEAKRLEHLELKMNHKFNNIIADQNKKIENMQRMMDIQSKAMELSKYKYIAITTDKKLTAFSPDLSSRYVIPIKKQKWTKSSRYLCKYKHHDINQKLFPSLANIHHNLHIMYKLGEKESTAHCLESSDVAMLPSIPYQRGSCGAFVSRKYGLLDVGGWNCETGHSVATVNFLSQIKEDDSDEKQEEFGIKNNKSFAWQQLTEMGTARYYPSICEIESKYLLVAGGDTGEMFSDVCELYDYDSGAWKQLTKLKHRRRSAGCCYWKEKGSVVIGGGYNKTYMQKVEVLDLSKDKWVQLPDTNYGHAGGPNVSICYDFCNNGVIFIAGILTTALEDWIEMYDLRSNRRKWINVCDIGQKVGFTKESFEYSKRPLHSILSI